MAKDRPGKGFWMERTLVVVKPDGVQRRLVGRILTRFEEKGLKLVGLKLMQVDLALARRMYIEHEGKDFYPRLVEFVTSSPVAAMVLEGKEVVSVVRGMVGPTFGPDAPPGTIRGDFGLSRRYNLVHASDSVASAEREIVTFFEPAELLDYTMDGDGWVYDMSTQPPT